MGSFPLKIRRTANKYYSRGMQHSKTLEALAAVLPPHAIRFNAGVARVSDDASGELHVAFRSSVEQRQASEGAAIELETEEVTPWSAPIAAVLGGSIRPWSICPPFSSLFLACSGTRKRQDAAGCSCMGASSAPARAF